MSAILLTNWNPRHPPDCPEFDYEHHREWRTILLPLVQQSLTKLARGTLDCRDTALETRPLHHHLFSQLTPPTHEYFAGHYRGEPFRCLQYYCVGIPSDPRVGVSPPSVSYWVEQLRSTIAAGMQALDADWTLSKRDRLKYLIVFSCRVFELFLRIHPYANGNGHIGRFMIWCILGRYGHWPHHWRVEPKPADPPYSDYIRRYRDGDKAPLEQLIASTLVP